MEELNQLRTRMREIKEEMAQIAKTSLPLEFKRYFDEWPEADAFRWAQYTPYFNDGEPCVFSVNQPYVRIGEGGGDDDDGWREEYDFEAHLPERSKLSDIGAMLQECDDVLEMMFGDHCQVTIWRNKNEAEVEEYEHE